MRRRMILSPRRRFVPFPFFQRRGETDNLEDAWAVQNVIGYLHGLTKVSNIVPILEVRRLLQCAHHTAPRRGICSFGNIVVSSVLFFARVFSYMIVGMAPRKYCSGLDKINPPHRVDGYAPYGSPVGVSTVSLLRVSRLRRRFGTCVNLYDSIYINSGSAVCQRLEKARHLAVALLISFSLFLRRRTTISSGCILLRYLYNAGLNLDEFLPYSVVTAFTWRPHGDGQRIYIYICRVGVIFINSV